WRQLQSAGWAHGGDRGCGWSRWYLSKAYGVSCRARAGVRPELRRTGTLSPKGPKPQWWFPRSCQRCSLESTHSDRTRRLWLERLRGEAARPRVHIRPTDCHVSVKVLWKTHDPQTPE